MKRVLATILVFLLLIGAASAQMTPFDRAKSTTGMPMAATDGTLSKPLTVDGSGNLNVNIQAGSSSGTQYDEDTVHVSGDKLIMSGVVQKSADGALSGDGDRSLLQVDANGYLKVNIKAGAGSGGTASADGAAYVAGTTNGTPMEAARDDTSPTACAEDKICMPRQSANRNLYFNIRDAAGNERGANVNASNQLSVSVDNTVTVGSHNVTNAGTFATQGTDNITQVGGNSINLGTGTTGTGTIRVVIATDQPQLTNKLLVTPDSVALPANQSVNVSQINGVTPLMGNGVTGTGSHRVTISSDNSNSAGIGGSATGSAVPSAARYMGGNGSGNLTGITVCDNWQPINQTTGTQIITGTSSKKTYICSINLITATAQNVALVAGTGTVCATGTAGLAGGTTAGTGWNFAANGGMTMGTGVGAVARGATNADNVCLLQSGSGQLSGVISWTQY